MQPRMPHETLQHLKRLPLAAAPGGSDGALVSGSLQDRVVAHAQLLQGGDLSSFHATGDQSNMVS